jgi:hypothetical protein
MTETVRFAVPRVEGDDDDDLRPTRQEFEQQDMRPFNGRVTEWHEFGKTAIAAVVFDSYDEALDAARNYPPNDRLESVPGEPHMCQLSEHPLWSSDDDMLDAVSGHHEQVQAAATAAGFIPPKTTH